MFKVRDLLIVASMFIGGAAVYYRSDLARWFEPAIAPIDYYVDAPKREAELQQEVSELRAALADLEHRLNHEIDLGSAREVALSVQCEELSQVRRRYAALCQRLVELGSELPSVVAAD